MSQCNPKIRIEDQPLRIGVRLSGDIHFEADFGVVHEVTNYNAEPYPGPYEVTPTVDEQILATAQKLMVDDLTVKGVPRYEVSNTAGGQTVYIAREV